MASSVPDSYGLIARLVERNSSVCSGMMELYDLCNDAVLIQPKGAVLERPQRCAEEMKRISALAAADAEEFLERFLRQHSD